MTKVIGNSLSYLPVCQTTNGISIVFCTQYAAHLPGYMIMIDGV
jgi:hypothetical protein